MSAHLRGEKQAGVTTVHNDTYGTHYVATEDIVPGQVLLRTRGFPAAEVCFGRSHVHHVITR